MILSQSLAGPMGRPDYRALPGLPLVVIEGPPGSGKSVLLQQLDVEWRAQAPVVRITLGGLPADTRPHQIAVRIADELLRRTPVPKRLFPRLFLGVAALEPPSLSAITNEAMAQLDDYSRQRAQAIRSVQGVVDQARFIVSAAVPDGINAGAVDAGLATVGPLTWRLRKQMPSWGWFAGATNSTSGLAGLVQLNRWEHGTPQQHAEVDAVLMRAFLADLRVTFTRWRHSERLTHNVLLLIDDADSPTGPDGVPRLRFVDDLEAARGADGGAADPLLVVATSAVSTASGIRGWPFGRTVERPTGPTGGQLVFRAGRPGLVHVVDLTDNLPPEPEHLGVVDRWCRSLAGGHRRAYTRFHRAGRIRPGHEASLETLFPPGIAEEIIGAVLDGQAPRLREELHILGAVGHGDPAAGTAFASVLVPSGIDVAVALTRQREVARFVARALWAGPAPERLHPFFRRALLTTLSAAPPPLDWDVVFERLAAVHDQSPEWRQHYLLARSGNVLEAARYLAQLLDRADPRRWLGELDVIVLAPRRRDPDGSGSGFAVALDAALRGGEDLDRRERDVATLVASLWLSSNHRGQPGHEEFSDAADALTSLLRELDWRRIRAEPLHTRAAEYRNRRHFPDQMV